MEHTLQIQVETSLGKKLTLSIKDVKDSITADEVKAIYEALKPTWNIEGEIVNLVSAKVVQTETQDFTLE